MFDATDQHTQQVINFVICVFLLIVDVSESFPLKTFRRFRRTKERKSWDFFHFVSFQTTSKANEKKKIFGIYFCSYSNFFCPVVFFLFRFFCCARVSFVWCHRNFVGLFLGSSQSAKSSWHTNVSKFKSQRIAWTSLGTRFKIKKLWEFARLINFNVRCTFSFRFIVSFYRFVTFAGASRNSVQCGLFVCTIVSISTQQSPCRRSFHQ